KQRAPAPLERSLEVLRAFDLEQPMQARHRGEPGESRLADTGAHGLEMPPQQTLDFRGGTLGKADLEIAPRNTRPAADQSPRQPPEQPVQTHVDAERQLRGQ